MVNIQAFKSISKNCLHQRKTMTKGNSPHSFLYTTLIWDSVSINTRAHQNCLQANNVERKNQ